MMKAIRNLKNLKKTVEIALHGMPYGYRRRFFGEYPEDDKEVSIKEEEAGYFDLADFVLQDGTELSVPAPFLQAIIDLDRPETFFSRIQKWILRGKAKEMHDWCTFWSE